MRRRIRGLGRLILRRIGLRAVGRAGRGSKRQLSVDRGPLMVQRGRVRPLVRPDRRDDGSHHTAADPPPAAGPREHRPHLPRPDRL
jgi:hypothetical protein